MQEYALRKHRGKYAIVHYDGAQRIRRSLGTDDPGLARTRLGEYIHQIEAGKRLETATVGQIVDAYLKQSEAIGLSIMHYNWKAARSTFEHLRPAHITKDVCKRYAAERGATVKPGTIRKELGVVRNALSWARRESWIAAAPHIEMPPAPPPRNRRLTREEAARLLEHCADAHIKLFVKIAINTAARAGAILGLTWRQVDLDRGMIDFEGAGRQKKRAEVKINSALLPALQQARKGATTPWVIEWGGKPLKSVRKGFATAAAAAGLSDVTPHVLRHTAATWLAEAGIKMDEIAQFLGHTDSRITFKIYARYTPEYQAKAAEALAG